MVAVLRSRIVSQRFRFAARELSGRRVPAVYRVRRNGLAARVVHNTADVNALDQSFLSDFHEPPPLALASLNSLGHPLRALDVGANVGLWGLWLHSRFPVEHVNGLEPDSVNVARHRHQIELNGLSSRWVVSECAATVTDGPVTFLTREGSRGSIVDGATPGASTVPGVDLFSLLDNVDLLKIDIEGGEWAILGDPRFAQMSVPVVMLEYHADNAPPGEPGELAQKAMERVGYAVELMPEFRSGFGTIWGRRDARSVGSGPTD